MFALDAHAGLGGAGMFDDVVGRLLHDAKQMAFVSGGKNSVDGVHRDIEMDSAGGAELPDDRLNAFGEAELVELVRTQIVSDVTDFLESRGGELGDFLQVLILSPGPVERLLGRTGGLRPWTRCLEDRLQAATLAVIPATRDS